MNLQQTLLITTPIILTGLAVAFAFRCGMFNIGGQGQYLVGAIIAVWVGSSFAGLAAAAPRRAHDRVRDVRRRSLRRHRGAAQGDDRGARGDHDDHAQLDRDLDGRLPFGQGGPLQNDLQKSVPISTTSPRARSCPCSGATRSCRGSRSGSSSRSRRSSSTGSSSTARRSASRCAPSASTPRRRATAGSRRAELLPRHGDRRPLRRARRGCRHPRVAVPARRARRTRQHDRIHRPRRALLGRNTAIGVGAAPYCSGRSSTAPRAASSTRPSSGPTSPPT